VGVCGRGSNLTQGALLPPAFSGAAAVTTYGQKAVGLSFNPSADPKVDRVKSLYAEIIDICYDLGAKEKGERARLFSVAITEAQSAQMWAVKAVTWKD
jgi:hypothetical protein